MPHHCPAAGRHYVGGIAGTSDAHDDGVVQEAIERRGGDDSVDRQPRIMGRLTNCGGSSSAGLTGPPLVGG